MLRRAFHGLRDIAYQLMMRVWGDQNGWVTLTTLRGPARGLRFKLDLNRKIEAAYWLGRYEPRSVRSIAELVQPGWTIWDCGVYLGFYTALFARLVGSEGQVVGFEPDPRNLERARANAALNRFANVEWVWAAIGAPLGETDFVLSDNTNSHLPGAYVGVNPAAYAPLEAVAATAKVRCISLDQAFEDEHLPAPNLIKIDIEGAEKDALYYLKHLVQNQRPIILLELHNPECDAAAWEFAQETRYSLQSMDTGLAIDNAADVHDTILCMPPPN